MTSPLLPSSDAAGAVPVHLVSPETLHEALHALTPAQSAFAEGSGFTGKAGRHVILPDAEGRIARVLFGLGSAGDVARTPFLPGKLAELLPAGTYRLEGAADDARLAALAFALGRYRFAAYTSPPPEGPRLVVPDGIDADELARTLEAVTLARDLVNTPANDMGPDELEAAARALAARFGAEIAVTGGEALARGFPLIAAVGRASPRAPRLIDFTWGDPADPKVTLVGKGVCFDTGGLDIKPSAAMLNMKKDMGGAANVLALALMVMASGLKVRLRVLVPAVENAISGAAFRPGDIFRSRKGLTVAIGNTDAEGRLVLADALALACEETPDLLIDMATLTGAARVALGPELPPFYTADEALAGDLAAAAAAEYDPLWRMPLWRPYESMVDAKVADIANAGSGGFAGSITAALFLGRFVTDARAWIHLDIFAWNPTASPGRPEGGEAQGIRALYRLIAQRSA